MLQAISVLSLRILAVLMLQNCVTHACRMCTKYVVRKIVYLKSACTVGHGNNSFIHAENSGSNQKTHVPGTRLHVEATTVEFFLRG